MLLPKTGYLNFMTTDCITIWNLVKKNQTVLWSWSFINGCNSFFSRCLAREDFLFSRSQLRVNQKHGQPRHNWTQPPHNLKFGQFWEASIGIHFVNIGHGYFCGDSTWLSLVAMTRKRRKNLPPTERPEQLDEVSEQTAAYLAPLKKTWCWERTSTTQDVLHEQYDPNIS